MKFPKFQLLEMIHRGSCSEVWKAFRQDLELPVALKVFAPNLTWDNAVIADWQVMFLTEAAVLPWLNHPSILRFFDLTYGTEGEMAIVTEFIRGKALDEVGGLSIEQAGMVAVRVLGALKYLQRPIQVGSRNYPSIIHGDLKPSNIMVTQDGVRLIDFGFSCLDPSLDVVPGTPKYLSPRRRAGRVPCWQDDVYSLAVSMMDLVGIPLDPKERRKQVSTPVAEVFGAMVDEKFESIQSVIDVLELHLGDHNYGPYIAALMESPRGGISHKPSEKI